MQNGKRALKVEDLPIISVAPPRLHRRLGATERADRSKAKFSGRARVIDSVGTGLPHSDVGVRSGREPVHDLGLHHPGRRFHRAVVRSRVDRVGDFDPVRNWHNRGGLRPPSGRFCSHRMDCGLSSERPASATKPAAGRGSRRAEKQGAHGPIRPIRVRTPQQLRRAARRAPIPRFRSKPTAIPFGEAHPRPAEIIFRAPATSAPRSWCP